MPHSLCSRWLLIARGSLLLAAVSSGCAQPADNARSAAPPGRARGPAKTTTSKDELIQGVIENLDHLEEFDDKQIMPQIRDRLNQWVQEQRPVVNWQLDPLVEKLPDGLSELQVVKRLPSQEYVLTDVGFLQEVVWLRDIAKTARSGQFDDVALAERLFDWTVRNLQLEPDPLPDQPIVRRLAAQVLLTGRANALERAWIFMLLAREQGLDAVLLALPQEGAGPRPWLPALVSDDGLYLFDSRLGLPVPGPEGKGVATLAQVAADDELLRRLDLSAKRPYPVKASDLVGVVALIEASPGYLARRTRLIASRLTGQQKLVLSTSPTALAERLRAQPPIADVQLWTLPFEVVRFRAQLNATTAAVAMRDMMVFQAVPPLSRGRALQFKGVYTGDKGAKAFYLQARPSEAELRRAHLAPGAKDLWLMGKEDASFWLGLIAFDEQKYPVAVDYFAKRTLADYPSGQWVDSARYNLARTYEASGEPRKAIELYEQDMSPQRHGNRLRARRLKQSLGEQAAEKPAAEEPASGL